MLKIICVGKIKDNNLKALINEYVSKVNHYHKLEIVEVKDEPIKDNERDVLRIEGERIINKINKDEYVILIDLHGKSLDSLTFSKKIDHLFISNSKITFVIGGSLGFDDSVRKYANEAWKLSDLTFLHQMTRLILLEQIYRSYKILNHEVYHK